MRIHVLQHVPFEGPSRIADWAAATGHALTTSHLYVGDPLPELARFDRLVVMGGPMGVGDEAEHSWLAPEKARIADAIAAGKSVVGICLGAQLIAEVLGARVWRNAHREIGWFPIDLTPAAAGVGLCTDLPRRLTAYHWHGDTFDLPAGAVHLARSEACEQQAFLYGDRVLALQCHLEATPEAVAALAEHCANEIEPGPWVQSAAEMLAAPPSVYADLNRSLVSLLERLPGPGADGEGR